ncbi:sugar ABC transporter permease [Paramicrobacterium chengjingii]|uniref:Sugar ABC transporter permease n=2 Tax=Paramicrobacterium chengjingii TaxID=2769067 RepID=A0ABX6YI29_9MICO|nr:sugar ABC transporter permease [Microbacterium chengjingii]
MTIMTESQRSAGTRPQVSIRARKDRVSKYLFIAPAIVVVLALLVYPVGSSVFLAFTDKHLLRQTFEFVGFDNFAFVLSSPDFWSAFSTSIGWTIGSIIGQLVIGFLAALALERIPRMTGLFRVLLIIPWAFPPIVIGFAWKWILNDVYGFFPNLLTTLGLSDENISLLGTSHTAFWVVLVINIWFGTPLFMVNILAALKTVPRDQQEAARMDGAGSVKRFRFITIPHVKKVVGLLLVLRTIWVFNNFELVFLLTGGGPAGSTTTLPIYAYRTGWGLYQLGLASTITVLLLAFLLLVGTFAFKLINRWESEDAR